MPYATCSARLFLCLVAFAAGVSGVQAQSGQPYPNRPIRLILPFAPGGGVDLLGRLAATQLHEALGQPVISDNRLGAGGTLGANIAAKAAPDGYTLTMANNSTHGVSQIFSRNLPYDSIRDFTPITLIAISQELILTRPGVPARNLTEFIALLKSKPGGFNFGSSGTGSHNHVVSELFKFVTGTDVVHIPYKGVGQTFSEVMSGQIQYMFSGTGGGMSYITSGRLRALAVTGTKRSEFLPDVPTFVEQGVTGFEEVGLNYYILGPAGLPRPIVDRLNRELVKIIHTPAFRKVLNAQALILVASPPEVAHQTIKAEIAKWAKLAKDTNLKID